MLVVGLGVVGLQSLVRFGPVTRESGMSVDVRGNASHILSVTALFVVTVESVDTLAERLKNLPAAPTLDESAEPCLTALVEANGGVGAFMSDNDVPISFPSVLSAALS